MKRILSSPVILCACFIYSSQGIAADIADYPNGEQPLFSPPQALGAPSQIPTSQIPPEQPLPTPYTQTLSNPPATYSSPQIPAVSTQPLFTSPSPALSNPPPVVVSHQIVTAQPVYVNNDLVSRQYFLDSASSGDMERMKMLVKTDPSLFHTTFADASGNTPLIRAATQRNTDVVRYLLDNGADINARNSAGQTALSLSYDSQNYDTTKYLLSRGAADPYNIGASLNSAGLATASTAGGGMTGLEIGGIAAAVVGGGTAVALGVGGGGGSSSPAPGGPPAGTINPENLNPGIFNTAEAQAQQGVLDMNTEFALALGYDGSIYSRNADGTLKALAPIGNVKVAVVDTGIDLTQSDLAGNILTNESFTCDNSGCVPGGADTNGHGTEVAGIIAAERNGVGIYGVASQAKLLSIGFADNTGALTNGDVPGIKLALDYGAQVFNGSYVATGITPVSASVATIQNLVYGTVDGTNYAAQFQRGVNNHALFVYAAGNESAVNPDLPAALPYYFQGATAPTGITQANYNAINPSHFDWSNNWVAVVSLNSSNTISSFSNECGIAMNWCLAAPGEISMSTKNGGGYATNIAGTSFAAPNVTGAVAVMLGAFPQLSPEKVLQILFDTATDLGAPGVDPVYGHGLVNLQKATSPTLGGWSLTASIGTSFAFTSSGFGLSAPFGNAVNSSNLSLQFLDAYGKNYTVPLASVAGNLAQPKTDVDRLSGFASSNFDNVMIAGENTKLGFSAGQESNVPDGTNRYGKFSYQSEMPVGQGGNDTLAFAMNFQTNLADAMMGVGEQRLLTSDALKNPYLNLVDANNSSILSYQTGQSKITTAVYFGKYQDEYDYRFDNNKNATGGYSEYTRYFGSDKESSLSLDSGITIEQNSFLGSETSGAFAIDKSVTTYTGLSGKYALTDDIALVGNYHMGVTKVTAPEDSMFTGFDDIVTNSFAAGAEWNNVKADHDQLSFFISQPLRVMSGNANLMLPVNVDSNGDILYSSGNLNLAPSGREMDFETSYSVPFTPYSQLSLDATFRKDPYNTDAVGNDMVFLGKYALNF